MLKMGCICCKMIQTGNLHGELKKRRSNGTKGLLISKHGAHQLIAILCAANAVCRRTKASSPCPEGRENSESIEPEVNMTSPLDRITTEFTSTRELHISSEEEHVKQGQFCKQESHEICKFSHKCIFPMELISKIENNGCVIACSRSYYTVEDYDNLVVEKRMEVVSEDSTKKISAVSLSEDKGKSDNEQIGSSLKIDDLDCDTTSHRTSGKEGIANELTVTPFSLSRSGSLRDWLVQEGDVMLSDTKVTPSIENFVSSVGKYSEFVHNNSVFDPEMVVEYEQAMEQLTQYEVLVLEQITGRFVPECMENED